MSIQDFDQLPFDEQTSFLWDQGVCLNQRIVDPQEIICIFSLEDFFVQAVYSRPDNRVVAITTLTDQGSWDHYVEDVLRSILQREDQGPLG